MKKKLWFHLVIVLSSCLLLTGFATAQSTLLPGQSLQIAPEVSYPVFQSKSIGFLNIKQLWQDFVFEYRMTKLLENEIEMTVKQTLIERKYIKTAA